MQAYQQYVTLTLVLAIWLITGALYWGLRTYFKRNPVSLINGLMVVPLLGLTVLAVTLTLMWLHLTILVNIILIISLLSIVVFAIVNSILGLLLLWNAAIVWQREQHSLANSLTLLLGLYLVLAPIVLGLLRDYLPKLVYRFLTDIEVMGIIYLLAWLICFGASFLVYKAIKPKLNKEYVIVLGAGLLNGDQISPLLKRRVDAALKFATKQAAVTDKFPLIVMSGGQGGDETIPEAVAMAAYARTTNFPSEYILTEEASKTTYQNMQFSKQLLIDHGVDLQRGIFVTSDYHVFRGARFAFANGLKINGIGARGCTFYIMP